MTDEEDRGEATGGLPTLPTLPVSPVLSEREELRLLRAFVQNTARLERESPLPDLSREQAYFLSWVLDGNSVEQTVELYIEAFGAPPAVEQWMDTDDFKAAVELGRRDRRRLIEAMSLALAGTSFRALAWLLEQNSVPARREGLKILYGMHNLLGGKGKSAEPEKFRELLRRLRERGEVIEGEYKVIPEGEKV